MARQVVVLALIFIAAFAAVASASVQSPSASPSKSPSKKAGSPHAAPATAPSKATISVNPSASPVSTTPIADSPEGASSLAPIAADGPDSYTADGLAPDADGLAPTAEGPALDFAADEPATTADVEASGAASLKISAAVGATAAAGFFFF